MTHISRPYTPLAQHLDKNIGDWKSMLFTKTAAIVLLIAMPFLLATGLIICFFPLLFFVAVLLAAIYLSYELRFSNPASDVWDHGSSLEFERRGIRQVIPLTQIRSIRFSTINTPPYSVVELHKPCVWGNVITWFPDTAKSRDVARAKVAEIERRIAASQSPLPPCPIDDVRK